MRGGDELVSELDLDPTGQPFVGFVR